MLTHTYIARICRSFDQLDFDMTLQKSSKLYPPVRSRGLDNAPTTGEKAASLHDATSAFDHEDNLDGQSDKQGHS